MVQPPPCKHNYREVCNARESRPELLFRLRGWIGGRGLRLYGLRLDPRQNRRRSPAPLAGVHRQRDGSDHECHSRPRRGFGKGTGRSARAERGLASLSAERSGDIAALAALQQHNHDDEETDQNVNSGDQVNHKFRCFPEFDGEQTQQIRSDFRRQVTGAEGGI